MTEPELESRRALHELIALLQEIDERYLGVEWGSAGGGYSTETAGVLNHTDFDIASDGSFEVFFGREPRAKNWLALEERASELIVRCYFEEVEPAAADVNRIVPLEIEVLEP